MNKHLMIAMALAAVFTSTTSFAQTSAEDPYHTTSSKSHIGVMTDDEFKEKVQMYLSTEDRTIVDRMVREMTMRQARAFRKASEAMLNPRKAQDKMVLTKTDQELMAAMINPLDNEERIAFERWHAKLSPRERDILHRTMRGFLIQAVDDASGVARLREESNAAEKVDRDR